MAKVAVVTDSTTYIPPDLLEGLPVFTIPQHVVWGGKSYRDDVDIRPEEFYERLKTDPELPQTSHATPEEFTRFYSWLIDKGYEILSIHVSSRVTNTLNAAILASQAFPGAVIDFVDSLSGSMGTGFQVLAAARAAVQGAALQECKKLAEQARQRSNILFIPGTLEFMRRGGRIGGAAAFLGSVLQVRPILGVRDGTIVAVERIRTMSRAIDRLLELVKERVGDQAPVHLASLHSNLPGKAAELLARACEYLGRERIGKTMISGISPTIGVHIGPEAVGLAYLAGMEF